jgi:hypothetical protein
MEILDVQACYGRPEAWREWLPARDGVAATLLVTGLCRIDGCES